MKPLLFVLCAGLLASTIQAHEGDHAEPAPAAAARPAIAASDPAAAALADGPRFALQSAQFEAVGVLDGQRIWLWLDHWADNRPVTGAVLTLTLGRQTLTAQPAGAAYRAELQDEPPEGAQPVVLQVRLPAVGTAPAADDRLTGSVTVVHDDDHDHDHEDAAGEGVFATPAPALAGALALLAALAGGWWLGRRSRPRAGKEAA